jgi:hypothetical protein
MPSQHIFLPTLLSAPRNILFVPIYGITRRPAEAGAEPDIAGVLNEVDMANHVAPRTCRQFYGNG